MIAVFTLDFVHISLCFCLNRVSENYENKMSPCNLGIVFGPTLLRPLVSSDMSMIALLETSYQAALVEFLITHHDKIFGLEQSTVTRPPPAPTAPLPDTPPRASCPLDGVTADLSARECPPSLEVSTLALKELTDIFFYASVALLCCFKGFTPLTLCFFYKVNELVTGFISAQTLLSMVFFQVSVFGALLTFFNKKAGCFTVYCIFTVGVRDVLGATRPAAPNFHLCPMHSLPYQHRVLEN